MTKLQHHDPQLSDKQALYEALDSKLRNSNFDGSAAQAHGIACGLVCRNVQSAALEQAIAYLNFTDDAALTTLEGLLEMSSRDLNQAAFTFDLWLPDVESLTVQLDALAEWSQGYIIGLMHDGREFVTQLSAELQESVQDIIEISGLESTSSDSNDDELAFIELREYLRMACQLIFEELNPDRAIEDVQE